MGNGDHSASTVLRAALRITSEWYDGGVALSHRRIRSSADRKEEGMMYA